MSPLATIAALAAALTENRRDPLAEDESGMVRLEVQQCPCCDRLQPGFPRRCALTGGQTTAHWPEHMQWLWRLELVSWVCPKCDAELGPDTVREELKALRAGTEQRRAT
jgi:hypothetical protein